MPWEVHLHTHCQLPCPLRGLAPWPIFPEAEPSLSSGAQGAGWEHLKGRGGPQHPVSCTQHGHAEMVRLNRTEGWELSPQPQRAELAPMREGCAAFCPWDWPGKPLAQGWEQLSAWHMNTVMADCSSGHFKPLIFYSWGN